jgi:endoglucanase
MDRVVTRAKAHGLTVILDRHRPDSAGQSPLWYTADVSESRWIADWRMLAARYAGDDTVIGVDLHNEPHGEACWGCGDPRRDWAAAATRAGNAVLEENPRLLVIIEGVQLQGDGAGTWWGGGLADVRRHPIRLDVPCRAVYSPHDYPPSIHPQSWFADGRVRHPAGDRRRPAVLSTLVDYLDEARISFAYWAFNPNSGDTGGLVADDWVTPRRATLDLLRPLLGAGTPAPPPTDPRLELR